MVTAIVLLNVARARVVEVAEKLAAVEGISEVYSVAGRFDLVAMVRVSTNEALADIVTTRMHKIDGIEAIGPGLVAGGVQVNAGSLAGQGDIRARDARS